MLAGAGTASPASGLPPPVSRDGAVEVCLRYAVGICLRNWQLGHKDGHEDGREDGHADGHAEGHEDGHEVPTISSVSPCRDAKSFGSIVLVSPWHSEGFRLKFEIVGSGGLAGARKEDVRLPVQGNSTSHDARPVHLITTMMKWIRTSRLPIKNSLSRDEGSGFGGWGS